MVGLAVGRIAKVREFVTSLTDDLDGDGFGTHLEASTKELGTIPHGFLAGDIHAHHHLEGNGN